MAQLDEDCNTSCSRATAKISKMKASHRSIQENNPLLEICFGICGIKLKPEAETVYFFSICLSCMCESIFRRMYYAPRKIQLPASPNSWFPTWATETYFVDIQQTSILKEKAGFSWPHTTGSPVSSTRQSSERFITNLPSQLSRDINSKIKLGNILESQGPLSLCLSEVLNKVSPIGTSEQTFY